MPALEFVGRDGELAAVTAALDAARNGIPTAVWIEGEAGSGKSTLVEQAVALARDGGVDTVWWATGDAEEQVIEHGLTEQLLRQAGVEPTNHSTELLEVVTRAGADDVVVLVVDDAHWCDHASRQSIRFLLRRLGPSRVLVLIAHRPMGEWPADTRRAASDLRPTHLPLAGLSLADVRRFMAARGTLLTPRAARRLHEHSGGNPQLLAMLADEVSPDELASGEGPLPAPRSFTDWVHTAYTDAEPGVRAVVGAVTVLGAPSSLAQIGTMTGLHQPEALVDEAIAQRLLRLVVQGSERLVEVSHALVRSAVNQAMTFTEFASCHERAAALTTDPFRRMMHRLHATATPDQRLLDEALALADEHARTGAILASARLLALVADRLPAAARRREIRVRAANRLLAIGELRWAEALLAEVSADQTEAPTPEELLAVSHLALQLHRSDEARQSAQEAWGSGTDPRTVCGAAEMLAYLALDSGDGEAATIWATRAIEAADTHLVALQLAGTALASGWALRGDLRPAREFLGIHRRRLAGTPSEPDILLGHCLTQLWTGALNEADESLTALERLVADGPVVLRSTVRLALAELDFRLGRWDDVLATTDTELAFIDEGWESRTAPMTLAVGAYVCAARGQRAEAAEVISRAEALLEPGANLPGRTMLAIARARIAAAAGASVDVVEALAPLHADARTDAIPEGVYAWRADLAEGLTFTSRFDEAALLLDVDVSTDPHARAGIQRARGVAAAAAGDHDEGQRLLEDAVAIGAEAAGRFAQARSEFALGALLRRRGRRRDAAELIGRARDTFAELGATPYRELARQELELCALRREAGVLTPAEETVARLAVAGHTNREIAERLTVSIKTVETHMGRIFTKMSVRSRVELVAALAEQD